MTGHDGKSSQSKPIRKDQKLPKLPKSTSYTLKLVAQACAKSPMLDARVHKRPLLRPPISSPHASAASQKVVYVSQKTPFVAAVKRVRKLLALADRRVVQSKLDKLSVPPNDKVKAAAEMVVDPSEKELVWIKATGKSIEKALQLALHFQNQNDCRTVMKTGSVWAVDDVVEEEPPPGSKTQEDEVEEKSGETPDTRLRQVSVLEVGISLR